MTDEIAKIGIISCSGEEIAEGTIARHAVRRVLEALRPQQTVTLCLPLFLAGEEGERRFAREHPTITVDGCSKLCAKLGTEKYSGRVSASLVVSDILGEMAKSCHRSTRDADGADEEAARIVAERIAAEVDALSGSKVQNLITIQSSDSVCCACNSSSVDGDVEIGGKTVTIGGLQLILQHLHKKGLRPDNCCGEKLLETVKVYHAIGGGEEAEYRDALVAAYTNYCRRQTE